MVEHNENNNGHKPDRETPLSSTRRPFPFQPENAKPVYHVLAEHQVTEESWELAELLAWLQLWAQRFIHEFDLKISEISLCADWLGRRRFGHFRPGANGFGLKGEIAINRLNLHSREPWELLGTLAHELLHAHQELYGQLGKHNYHKGASNNPFC